MSEFDDDQLRSAIGRRSGGAVPVDEAHMAVVNRSGTIRRRRAAFAGAAALVTFVVGGLVFVPRNSDDSQAPADSGDPIPTVADTPPSTTDDSATTSTVAVIVPDSTVTRSTVVTSMVPSTTDSPATSTTIADRPTTSSVSSPTTSTAAPTSSTSAPSTTSAPTTSPSTTSPSTTSAALAPFTRTYDSNGGSITVNWDGSSLTLRSVTPAAGFEAEIEDQAATRVRVRFRGEPDDTRIEVRVDGGELRVDIS